MRFKSYIFTVYAYAAFAGASSMVTAPDTIRNVGVPPVDQQIADDMADYTSLNSTFLLPGEITIRWWLIIDTPTPTSYSR